MSAIPAANWIHWSGRSLDASAISSAASGCFDAYSSACIWLTERFTPQRSPRFPHSRTNRRTALARYLECLLFCHDRYYRPLRMSSQASIQHTSQNNTFVIDGVAHPKMPKWLGSLPASRPSGPSAGAHRVPSPFAVPHRGQGLRCGGASTCRFARDCLVNPTNAPIDTHRHEVLQEQRERVD